MQIACLHADLHLHRIDCYACKYTVRLGTALKVSA